MHVNLAVSPPLGPMLAKRVSQLPEEEGWIFEPKWDGFRALIFRDGDEVLIQSRDGKSLNRYFPELIDPLRDRLPARCVLDGEIVIAGGSGLGSGGPGLFGPESGIPQSGIAGLGGLDFEALQLRIHPAATRVRLLSEQTPASIVFFDLLCLGDRDLRPEPFEHRRAELVRIVEGLGSPLHLTPATRELAVASDWFQRFEGAGLDGVMAKSILGPYEADKRTMLKVKHERDCDCVVGGFRWHKDSEGTAIGSLLLGLYNAAGELQHVGTCASFTLGKRREMVEYLAPFRVNASAGHPWGPGKEGADSEQRVPGSQSRWSQGKDLSWEPLRPELVVEVAYEHMQGSRFRHMAQFRRWRLDKPPLACTYAQLEVVAPQELKQIFSTT